MTEVLSTPDGNEDCAYCTLAIFEHDPICVRDCTTGCDDPTYFCNYACLTAYIDENNLTHGNTCEWDP